MAILSLVFAVLATAAPRPAPRTGGSAADVVRDAVLARLGAGADVTVLSVDVAATANDFRDARPDPLAVVGKPVRFTLVVASGGSVPATVQLRVVADRLVTRRAIERGEVLQAADVDVVRDAWIGLPLRRLPTVDEAIGAKVLRPMAPGATVGTVDIAIRRAVEPGDRVTVVIASADVEVTATLVAADGGRLGDDIRVVNPDTRRSLRGRIVEPGMVEVVK